jgi:hypothetical protein
MQNARLIVAETRESIRKDFEIMCYGEHISLCFWSGKRENKIGGDRSQVIIMLVSLNTKLTSC